MIELAGEQINRLGMGCWAIGGPFFSGADPLAYGEVDDEESIRAVHCALDLGIRYFDTADVYGAGHSERVLATALDGRDDVLISTKFGHGFDSHTKQVTGDISTPSYVSAAIEGSLRRLRRDRIEIVFLHLNVLPVQDAEPLFEELEALRKAGKIATYGWSTDFPDNAKAMIGMPGFTAVQHAMNLFVDAPSMMRVVEDHDLVSVNRSPLAMGVLTGKFATGASTPRNDIRQNNFDWLRYFKDGKVRSEFVDRLTTVRHLLQSDGRTLSQGALGWLWAKSPRTLPIPGFRNVAQVQDNAGALEKGPLRPDVMAAIEEAIEREPDAGPRES